MPLSITHPALSLEPNPTKPTDYGRRVKLDYISDRLDVYRPKEKAEREKIFLHRKNAQGVIHVVPVWQAPDTNNYVVLDVTRRGAFGEQHCLEIPGGIWRNDESPAQTVNRIMDTELSLDPVEAKVLNQQGIAKSPGYAKSPGIIGELMYTVLAKAVGPKVESKKPGVTGHILVPVDTFVDNQKFETFLQKHPQYNVGMEVNVVRGLLSAEHDYHLNFQAPDYQNNGEGMALDERDVPYPTPPVLERQGYVKILESKKSNVFRLSDEGAVVYVPQGGNQHNWLITHVNGITAAVHDVAVVKPVSGTGEKIKPTLENLKVPVELNLRRPVGYVLELPAGKWEPDEPETLKTLPDGSKIPSAIMALAKELKEETGLKAIHSTILGGRSFATSTGITNESKVVGLTDAEGEVTTAGQTASEANTIKSVFFVSLKDFLDLNQLQHIGNEKLKEIYQNAKMPRSLSLTAWTRWLEMKRTKKPKAVLGSDIVGAHGLLTKEAFQRAGIEVYA